jgi:precorrin-6Y C5,15-methyltransferase (decarboxylating)
MKKKIKIIGCGVGSVSISEHIRAIVADANLLVGGERLLKLFPEHKGEKLLIKNEISKIISDIKAASKKKTVVILASGDPLFHGIGGTIGTYFDKDEYEVVPNITAAQYLFAKLAVPWENARFFSVHGGRKINFRLALISSLSAIYCDNQIPASVLAGIFVKKFPAAQKRIAVIAENLGTDDEKIREGTLLELSRRKTSGLSILLLLPSSPNTDIGFPLGIPDADFIHENRLITHPEIRAIVISKLKLGPGVMWDIGAGSGSVGIEAASLCPELEPHFVEKNSKRVVQIIKNAENFGISKFHVHRASALDIIGKLPSPRAVFIGGGSKDISEILKKSFSRLIPSGRIIVSAVLMETKAALTGILPENFIETLSVSISRSSSLGGGRILKPENPVDIFVFEK